MRDVLKRRYHVWLDKRLPSEATIELTQRRLFIVPSKNGAGFLLILLVLLLVGINYQNNLAYALCFFLFSLFITAILLTFFNLQGVSISLGRNEPVFLGDRALINLTLHKKSGAFHHNVRIGFDDDEVTLVDLVDNETASVSLPLRVSHRGINEAGRFFIKTQFPLGLVTCWASLKMPAKVMVYPKPLFTEKIRKTAVRGDGESETLQLDGDDFAGFNPYQPGDSRHRIHWRGLAKGQGLQSKLYQAGSDKSAWVDWYALSSSNTEEKLSQLCGQIVTYKEKGLSFGLRLPTEELQPATGQHHVNQVLSLLALYPA